MATCWSAKNATNAYLRTLRMVGHSNNKAEEPEAAEFISALAAGNNSQLMVIAAASSSATSSTILALVAAAHQTGGRVVCIHSSEEETELSKRALGPFWKARSEVLDFVTGRVHEILGSAQYEGVDFVAIDCNLEGHEKVLGAARERNGVVVVGYNADFNGVGSWWRSSGWRTQMLPIGDRGGLLVTRVLPPTARKVAAGGGRCGSGSGSRWVVKVDQCTGEEHVFRVR